MGRKQRHSASTPATYMPFGRPSEVSIVHVEAEKAPDGSFTEARWEERFAGLQVGVVKAGRGADSDDFHPTTCKGKRGVARVWERDGRQWCRGCYVMRYGVQPPADIEVRARAAKQAPRPPQTELERMMRRPFL